MGGDWGFVVWIVVLAIPLGLFLVTRGSRSRGTDAAAEDEPERLP